MTEAVEQSGNVDFVAESYFTKHADFTISSEAASLCSDAVQLTKSLQLNRDEEFLRNQAVHLVLDYKLNRVEKRLKTLRKQLGEVQTDTDKMMEVIKEIREEEELRNAIAKKLGNNIR